MSDLDLSAALDAAWMASTSEQMTMREARAMVVAAAPLIEAAVREQIAAEILALGIRHVSSLGSVFDDGFTSAIDLALTAALDGRA